MRYTVETNVTMIVNAGSAFEAASTAVRQLSAPPLAAVEVGWLSHRVVKLTEDVQEGPVHHQFPPNPDEHHSPHFSTYDKGSCVCNCPQCTEQNGADKCICPWCQDSSHLHGAR